MAAAVGSLRLVDTQTRAVYQLSTGRQIIASHPYLLEHASQGEDPPPSHLILPPPTPSESYCCEVVLGEEGGCVSVLVGECQVNGEPTIAGEPRKIRNGAFINLGQSVQLQLTISSVNCRKRRVLPQTPGKPIHHMPPSKPKRIPQPPANSAVTSAVPLERSDSPGGGLSGSGEGSLSTSLRDPGLRSRLQRISREVNERRTGYHKRKPPPPYEQVGNSIGFQLLLQSHKDVTSPLIDSLYAPLKELEMKDPGVSQRYSTFLQAFGQSLEEGATHECMHPQDIPTLHFLTDLILHCCSMPQLIDLAKKHCPLWLHLVAVFSASGQNQLALVEQRSPSQILSCMNLGLMAESVSFQRHGWDTLAHVVGTPTPPGKKPVLREPSVTLAVSLIEQQLEKFSSHLQLVGGVMHFLGQLASTVKACTTASPEGEPVTYSPEQAGRILGLLREHGILRHVMKVPQELRQDKNFDANYCTLVKALVPTRSRNKKKSETAAVTTPTTAAPIPPGTPPKKPKRLHKNIASRQSRQSRKLVQPPLRASSAEDLPDCSTDPAPTLPPRHAPSPPSRRRSKSVDELDYDSDGSSHTHSLPDVLWSNEDISVSKLKETMGDTARKPVERKGGGAKEGSGEERKGGGAKEGSGEDRKGGGAKEGSGEERKGGGAKEGSGEERKGGGAKEGSGEGTKGGGAKEGSGEERKGGGAKEDSCEGRKGLGNGEVKLTVCVPGEVSAGETEEETGVRGHGRSGEEAKHMAPAKLKVEEKPSAGRGEAGSCEERVLRNHLGSETAAVHTNKEDTPLSNESLGMQAPVLSVESQKVVGGVANGRGQGVRGESLRSDSRSIKEIQPQASEGSTDRKQAPLQHPSLSPLTSPSPPSTPDSLAGEVQSLLSQIRAPVAQGNINNNNNGGSTTDGARGPVYHVTAAADGPTVLVPEVTQGSHYYRHSIKRRKRREARPPAMDTQQRSQELEELRVVYRDSAHHLHPSSAHRMSWDPSTPLQPLAGQQESQFFEHSGEFLSKEHTALEDLSSGHGDIKDSLTSRHELLEGICKLWRQDKGLQAATNALTACFSAGIADISLFTDILACFCAMQSPWTLAVCVVMLPALKQLMGNQREELHLQTVCTALTMVVKRFSDIIQTAKNPKRSSRLSSRVDRSQKEVCYRELHHSWLLVGERLGQDCDTPTVTGELSRLKAVLEPYSQELDSR